MKILAVWYSRSGTTTRIARQAVNRLQDMGHDITAAPIHPVFDLPYPLWLALSFLPRSRFPLSDTTGDVTSFDSCFLACPKWTFSCPPLNTFLARQGRRLPPTGVVVTCGGWDQERYLQALVARFASMGVTVLGDLLLKRREVEEGAVEGALAAFLERCFPRAGT